jgi:hypothetical protein
MRAQLFEENGMVLMSDDQSPLRQRGWRLWLAYGLAFLGGILLQLL